MELALLIAIFIGSANAACPSNFVASTTIPGKCYYLETRARDFFSAINYCRNLTYGADILSIANEFENREVARLLQPRGIILPVWIGNAFYDNKLHWLAIATGSSNYSNWRSGTYNGHVVLITSSGRWSSAPVDSVNSIICQIYPDDPTTFPPPQITCPTGWTPSISVRGKCYRHIGKTDFFSATRNCLTTRIGDSHAELVTLTSQFEMMELDAMRLGSSWASLTSWEADGHWHWVETLHPTDYFGPNGQPSNSGGTCAYLDNFNLYGVPCWDPREAICQYFPNEPLGPPLHGLNCPRNGIASLTKPGTCYYVLSQRQSFQSARNACRTLNNGLTHNDLFVPRTTAEYEEFEWIVHNQATSHLGAWLGLTSSHGNWDWISGQPNNISNIWCSGQPDTSQNPNYQCAFVIFLNRYNICWVAGDCANSYATICQSTNTF